MAHHRTCRWTTARDLLPDPWRALPSTWFHVRFPLATDAASSIEDTVPQRVVPDISDVVVPDSNLPFDSVQQEGDLFRFTLSPNAIPHRLTVP